MSIIAKGASFTTGLLEDGSRAHFHALVDSATVTSIAATEFSAGAHVVQVDTATPAVNQGAGSLWFDKTLMILRQRNSTRWDAPLVGPEMLNNTAATIGSGILVVASASNEMSPCITASWPEVVGVTTGIVNPGATGIVRRCGVSTVALAGPCTVGDTLISAGTYTSWSSGRAMSARVAGATTVTAGIEIGMCMTQVGITTALATCLVWR